MAAILIDRWQMKLLGIKAHDILHRFARSSTDRLANNTLQMATPRAPSNMHPDSMTPLRAMQAKAKTVILVDK